MKQAYKQLGISKNDPHLIEIATERKNVSIKSIETIIFSIFFGLFGLFCIIATLALVIYTIMSFPNKAISLSESFLLVGLCILAVPIGGGIGVFFFMGGFTWLLSKPAWYLALLTDKIQYNIYDEEKKTYEGHIVPINKLKQLVILQTENVNYVQAKGRSPKEEITFRLSFHLQYEANNTVHEIHLNHPDGLKEMNTIISKLQNHYKKPIYYAFAPGEAYNYEKRKVEELIKQVPIEPITFTGSLEDYKQQDYTRGAKMTKALQSTAEYIKRGNKNNSQSK